MKKLKKILLINWLYFDRELIEVGDVNFLTGRNGAGKSTVIDALQIVLLGETNARNFNLAANERSQRTLDGYLRADMDENNPRSRRGKDFSSYIVCEFYDDAERSSFVCGVMFDCRRDGSRRDHFFIYTGTLPGNCFIENGEAIDLPSLRRFLKENCRRAEVCETQWEYRRNLLSRWNVHTEQVFRMLKKAVSFRPIVDIQQFITENICDVPDKPDIEAMQQNIRDYKRHEQMAQRQEEKLAALNEIAKLYGEMRDTAGRWKLESFLVHWSRSETLQAQIDGREQEKRACSEKRAAAQQKIDRLAAEVQQKEAQRQEYIRKKDSSNACRELEELDRAGRRLLDEQEKLTRRLENEALEIKREALRLAHLGETVLSWDEEGSLDAVCEAAQQVRGAYEPLKSGEMSIFAQPQSVFETAQEATDALMNAMQEASHRLGDRLAEAREQLGKRKKVLAGLRDNVKDYPRGLLACRARLESELAQQVGAPVAVNILADVLEIADEAWRGAVEGYLGSQKLYFLVEPAYYPQALRLYDSIRRDPKFRAFGLVDIGSLREKEKLRPMDGSLAGKVETENPLARTYVDYLLGRVKCCASVDELRQYRTAITAEGMLYQGYVARALSRERMEDAFIGRYAVTLRIRRLEEETAQLEDELARREPVFSVLSRQKQPLLLPYFVQKVVPERQGDYLRVEEIREENAALEEQRGHINLMWIEEQEALIERLSGEIHALSRQKEEQISLRGQLDERIRQLTDEILPGQYREQSEMQTLLEREYTEAYRDETGVPRYRMELARLKKPENVLHAFSESREQAEKDTESARSRLFAARRAYAERFAPCPFRAEALDNDEFDAERRALEESELPRYRRKIRAARESAMEQFQNDFLSRLKSSIEQVQAQVRNLNRALRQAQFGTDSYQFRVDRSPDYADYYDMIMAPELMEGDITLFSAQFQEKYGPLIDRLFSQITMADDTQPSARRQSELQENIERFTDFRTYLKFDLETTDQNGSKQLLSQTMGTKSGGETQTPFYISVLASFAQLYRVSDTSSLGNTVRLVVFDEAFNKMDSERIVESVRLLRGMGLQAVICTPPDKVADLMPIADRTLLVDKQKYRMHILPFGKELAQE